MKAHIARNQNAGVPLVLEWNLSGAARGILDGMSAAFRMKCIQVRPDQARHTVAQLASGQAGSAGWLEPSVCPSAIVLVNFKPQDAANLFRLLDTAQAGIPLRTAVTQAQESTVFADLLARMQSSIPLA